MTAQRWIFVSVLLLSGYIGVAASTGAAVQRVEHHCAVVLDVERAEPGDGQCYADFTDAMFFATGGRVRLDPSVKPSDVTEQLLRQESVEPLESSRNRQRPGSVPDPCGDNCFIGDDRRPIGIDYQNSNFGIPSITWSVPNTWGCTNNSEDWTRRMPNVDGVNWDNRVSSARALGGCRNWIHWQFESWSGGALSCTCQTMGSMNDKTSSEEWFAN